MSTYINKEKLYYLKYALFHPFDGFYEVKYRGKGSALIAVLILVLYGVLQCISYQYKGFVINLNPLHEMNSINIFISSLSILLLFVVSNWTVTTLFNGKGTMRDILIITGYSLLPMIILSSIMVFASNFIIEEEAVILYALQALGIIWFVYLMIAGLCVIHEYSFGLNITTIAVTLIAAVIIVFLGILFFTLIERMVDFFTLVGRELTRRL